MMKGTLNKMFSVLLALSLCMSLLSVTAFASQADGWESEKKADEAISALMSDGSSLLAKYAASSNPMILNSADTGSGETAYEYLGQHGEQQPKKDGEGNDVLDGSGNIVYETVMVEDDANTVVTKGDVADTVNAAIAAAGVSTGNAVWRIYKASGKFNIFFGYKNGSSDNASYTDSASVLLYLVSSNTWKSGTAYINEDGTLAVSGGTAIYGDGTETFENASAAASFDVKLRLFKGDSTADADELAYSTANVEITDSGTYTVSGTGNHGNNVVVSASDVTLYLDNITLKNLNSGLSAIKIADGCAVNIVVVGTCSLTGGGNGAGIEVPETAAVTISGDDLTAIGNGGVETRSDVAASGIGAVWGANTGNSGEITVSGLSSLTAIGYGKQASGIGKCKKAGTSGDIILTDIGTLYAAGGCFGLDMTSNDNAIEGGAGIGGGGNATDTNRTAEGTVLGYISMNNVQNATVLGGSKSAAIGASYWGSCVIDISGCEITNATGGATASAIGAARINHDSYDRVCDITITDTVIENAVGGFYGSAIGTGCNGDSCGSQLASVKYSSLIPYTANITIEGSTVSAYGGQGGAAIGGGYKGHELNINIDGGSTVYAVGGYINDSKKMSNDQSDASAIGTGADGSNGPYTACAVTIGTGADVTALARGDKFAIDTNKGVAESNVTGGAKIIQGTFVDTGRYEGLNVSIRNYDSTASAAAGNIAMPAGYRSFARCVSSAGKYLVYATDGNDGGVASYFAYNTDIEKRLEKTENNTEAHTAIYIASASALSDNYYLYPATTEIVLPTPPADNGDNNVTPVNDTPATIPDTDTPLDETPAATDDTPVIIPDAPAPLAEVPATGDISNLWLFIAIVSGAALIALNVKGKKREI
ncbi:MAG: hypothetical protein VB112_08125 [Oscillospiraceae bacterium]|nr:hypothetical protein [Oscillospiraceae bacterium]